MVIDKDVLVIHNPKRITKKNKILPQKNSSFKDLAAIIAWLSSS